MMGMVQTFWTEAKEHALDFFDFCKKEKGLRWFTAILLVTFWGIKLVYNDVFIDSEIMSLEPWALLQSWYGHKRYGLILMKRLFSMIRLVPYLSNLLFLAAFWGMILLVCYSLRQWFGGDSLWANRRSLWMFSAFWVTAPSLAEQYAFTLQAFEITLAMVFCVLAAYFADLAIVKNRSKIWYLAALGFLVWGLASYQGLCSFYIALVLMSFHSVFTRSWASFYVRSRGEAASMWTVCFCGGRSRRRNVWKRLRRSFGRCFVVLLPVCTIAWPVLQFCSEGWSLRPHA